MLSNQPPDSIKLHFLLPPDGDVQKLSDEMKMAFQECDEASLKPKWITADEAKNAKMKTDVIVMEQFLGELFEHLKKEKCVRICGPRCLRTCLAENSQIPETNSPIYMTTMRGLVVTATNLTAPKKLKVKEKVSYMGGIYSNNLVESVTHVACGGVRSDKYDHAASRGLALMTTDWVNAVWEAGLNRNVHATDREFDKYKCPIFYNLEITSTNLPNSEKNKLKQLISTNGGIFSGQLKQNMTDILIIGGNPSTSKKYQFARSWEMTCVKSSWVHESVEKGFAVSSQEHLISPTVRCSTPTESKDEMPSFMSSDLSIVSTIPCKYQNDDNHKSQIDETNMTTLTGNSSVSYNTIIQERKMSTQISGKAEKHAYKKLVESLNVADAKRAGPFLDGCKVYLSGFASQEQDKLKRILNVGGAVIFTELTDAVSHVITGDFVSADATAICKILNRPHMVTVEWLLASMKEKAAAAESLYSTVESYPQSVKRNATTHLLPPAEPPSPLSQKGMQLLMKKNQFKTPDAVKTKAKQNDRLDVLAGGSGLHNNEPICPVNRNLFLDFIAEDGNNSACKSVSSAAVNTNDSKNKMVNDKNDGNIEQCGLNVGRSTTVCANDDGGNERITAGDTTTQSSTAEHSSIFKDLVFMVMGFESELMSQLEDVISENGGSVVLPTFRGVTDYTVLPVYGLSLTGIQSEVVTPFWLEDCKQSKSVLPVEYYHQPISVAGNKTPLQGCVVTLSIYTAVERQFLGELVVALGALCQETFARKTSVAKGVNGNTHLVIPTSGSSKYNAAIKWNIPVVTKDWLLNCAKLGTKVPETPYLVTDGSNDSSPKESCGKTGANENESRNFPPVTPSVTSMIDTPLKPVAAPSTTTTPNTHSIPTASTKDVGRTVISTSSGGLSASLADSPAVVHHDGYHSSPKVRKISSSGNTKLMTPVLTVIRKDYTNMSTPETPYEQILEETGKTARKRIKRMINNLDGDKPTDDDVLGVPVAQKRLSTPLSELLHRALRKFGNTPDDDSMSEDNPRRKSEFGIEDDDDNVDNGNKFKKKIDENSTPPSSARPKTSTYASSLAEKLEKLNRKLSSPTPNTTPTNTGIGIINQRSSTSSNNSSSTTASVGQNNSKDKRGDGETSSASSVASTNVRSNINFDSQKNDIGWEEPIESAEKAKVLGLPSSSESTINSPKDRKFVLSNVFEERKEEYERMILSLGGELLKMDRYNDQTTHILTNKPIRSEKLLCSIAAGRWVLHISYLEESYKSKMFLAEEDFEWGNPKSKENIPPLSNEREQLLANAAFRWRTHIQSSKQPTGAYDGFKAVLFCANKKLVENLSRLIVAGKGILLTEDEIFESTHVFVDDPSSHPISRYYKSLAAKNIYCLPPVYLSDFLTDLPVPDPADNTIAEYKKYLNK